MKKAKRLMCLVLALLMTLPILSACSSEEEPEVTLPPVVPDTQIFEDNYKIRPEITDMMTYTTDYVTSSKSIANGIDILRLFDYMEVQVDDWDCVSIGESTLGDLAAAIDAANERYVAQKTQEIIDKRQAVIDEEYAAAKKKAEESGKPFNQEKKKVRTDDIVVEKPYTYTVTLSGNKQVFTEEYKPTLLIDPSKYNLIYFDVAKYGIPYVWFQCRSVKNLYNLYITQESDWVINAVQAADVTSECNPETGEYPEYVDADGLNKAAKQNIVMSGNVAFGGKGFTWESLKTFCDALELTRGAPLHGFQQSSDQYFTYYVITLYTNPFYTESVNDNDEDKPSDETTPTEVDNTEPETTTKVTEPEDDAETTEPENDVLYYDGLVIPTTRLCATFDPLTQVCINWTIDTYSAPTIISKKMHDLEGPEEVNVHEYQVDTNNYEAMRETIKSWIAQNALETTTAYCAFNDDDNSFFGIVESGLSNMSIEIVVDGKVYYCLAFDKKKDGSYTGQYISTEDFEAVEAMDNSNEAELYKREHTKTLNINCYLLDKDNNVVATFNPGETILHDSQGNLYYVADYNLTESGYKDVRILAKDRINGLLMTYTKTYKLSAQQSYSLQSVFDKSGALAVRDYINEMFAQAEEDQKKQQEHSKDPNTTTDPTESTEETTPQN